MFGTVVSVQCLFHSCCIALQRCELSVDNHMTTRRNCFSFGDFMCAKAHRCIKALRNAQTEHAASQLYTIVNRRTCSSVPAPRITTHYTIRPRDQDSRWEGKAAELIIHKILYKTQFDLLTSRF